LPANVINTNIKIAYSKEYVLSLDPDHKFPISKYKLIPDLLLSEGTVTGENIFAPESLDRSIAQLTHSLSYIERLLNLELTEREVRKIGFPQSRELIDREFIITGGTVQGSLFSLEYGIAFNVAGGTHHAYRDRGEGFCLLNDTAVASNYLIDRKYVERVFILDLDVHQGNGTAKIFANEPRVFTFSMHGASNYPLYKEKSDLDIPLKAGTDDRTYMKILKEKLEGVINDFQPDLIQYIAGVDVLKTDRWGMLGMSIEGVKERDRYVMSLAESKNIPVMITMGGGYSNDVNIITEAHANTFRSAFDIY
jgi:acetoin utilization deacetylase AcuC-like enzyme